MTPLRSHPATAITMSYATSLAIAAIVGLLSGAHAAMWGMYKDCVYEGFGSWCFARSIIVGAAAAVILQAGLHLPLPTPPAVILLFGLAYAAERGVIEVWKTFIREGDQSKFFIPMTFSVRGVPVRSRGLRLLAGAGYVAVVGLCLVAVARLQGEPSAAPSLVSTVMVGLTVGIVIATGGAWKDAPKEGFDVMKFFRSPSVTTACAIALSAVTDSYLYIAVAAMGFERALVETYKTIRASTSAPGKFAGKPELYPALRTRRQRILPVFLGVWVLVAGAALAELQQRLASGSSEARIVRAPDALR